jgi:cob(I)alamin adenosyltransferase
MSEQERLEASEYYNNMLSHVIQISERDSYDVLVLDEIMSVYQEGMIERETLIEFLKHKPDSLEIVLTGRNPDETLVSLADYVSEIKKVKHPFDQGIPARKGIEM